MPNLISLLDTCKVRRLNQLRSTHLYLGRPYRSIRLRQSNRTAGVRFRFRRRTSHAPNLMLTLQIHYINYIIPTILHVQARCHAQKACFEKERTCSSCFKNTKYLCVMCNDYRIEEELQFYLLTMKSIIKEKKKHLKLDFYVQQVSVMFKHLLLFSRMALASITRVLLSRHIETAKSSNKNG